MRYLLLVPVVLVLVTVIGLLLPFLRWVFRLGAAAAAALVAAAILPLEDGQGWVPFAIFAAVLLLLSIRGRRAPRSTPARAMPTRPAPPPGAWPDLRRLADWGQRRRLDAARAACDRYLALAATEEDESAQLPIRVGKHLPTIVADCVRHCRTATRDEQRALVARTLTAVETLAAQAETRRRDLAHQAQTRFRTLEAHLARRDD